MLQVARNELEYERVQMVNARAGKKRAKAFIEFLERTDKRRSALYPFNQVRDTYLSAGFGGVQAGELEKHRKHLNYMISYARRKKVDARELEEVVALLEKDISQLKTVEDYEFCEIMQFMTVKSIWWGQSALCLLSYYGYLPQSLSQLSEK